ncbi:DUF3890 domain-containing protein [Borrelia hermsii]|uniref:DUF3890 domain-containing protein n=2 Tax=Borrelia hermsii TaxID=140 RepID=T1ECB8_BORHE|nr:DUF3890 domain-containing protein [Borrelia hermsii]ADN26350.1 hypothetical protein BHA094 [Borrelia hermsii]AHH12975.1 Hypothetical protein BHO_0021000 [Borrelia hermsii YBT]AMR75926.1 hypothetical protein A0V01_04765 [Borrelia hermsii]ANA43735.1 hypothetical protein AXX13_A0455 [Borrelia hermsii HS1]UPA08524.1 DUF3890 domain-containing protein [Borrelia hermsii DAH]
MDNDLDKIYAKVLSLLMLSSDELNFKEFNVYVELLEDVLLSKGLGLGDLSMSKVFLLIYYFLGCELKKRGKLLRFDFNKVKSERLNEISVEYSDYVLRDEALSKDFCVAFSNLVEEIKACKRALIGVV